MLYIPRCQALKRPLRWSAKPLTQSIVRRPLSQSSILFLRRTPCFRQEEPTPSFRDKVGPLEHKDSFYNKVGKPGIRNQVIVSRVYFVISSPTCISKLQFSEVRSRWVISDLQRRCSQNNLRN